MSNPFLLENTGNILVNVTITATPLFNQTSFPSGNYEFKVDVNESGAFNTLTSTVNFTNVTNATGRIDIVDLNWSDFNDTAEIDLNVTTPDDEPAGTKSSNVTFEAV